jgi:hypothetical protein
MAASPYRESVVRPAAKAVPAPSVLARRAAGASVVPQFAIALAFFLPAVDECHRIKSVADVVAEQDVPYAAAFIILPFAMALWMAATTVLARVRRRPPRAAALVATSILWLYPGGILLVALIDALRSAGDAEAGLFGVMGVALAPLLGALCALAAWPHRGWVRWAWLIAGQILGASPFAIFFLAELVEGGFLVGACVFVLSHALLVAVQLRWVAARRSCAHARKARRALLNVSPAAPP